MKQKSRTFRLIPLAVMGMSIACIFDTAAGSGSTPQVVVVTSTRSTEEPEEPSFTPTLELASPATVASVTLTAGQELSCVKGPHWALYEWVAKILEGETVTLLARAPEEWADYYYIRKADGTECWAFGGSSAIAGDAAGLPEREAPPLPQITLTVRNETYLRINNLRMRPKEESVWGTNLLASHEIMGQETYGLTLTAGFYDIRILDTFDGIVYESHDVPIGAEPSSNTIVLNGRYTINIHSESTIPFCQAHIESLDHAFNADLTIPGDGRISPGENVSLEGLGGIYVLEFYACSGSVGSYGIAGAYIGPDTQTYTIH